MTETPPTAHSLTKRLILACAKLLVVGLVVWFVHQTVRDAWSQIVQEGLTIHPALALLAGLAYAAGQAPMAWYWRKTLVALDQPAPLWPSIIAFYISQIGKYVPGKGMVVLIRTERMLHWGGRGRTIAAAVFVETLTMMAVGAVLSAVLLAYHGPKGEAGVVSPWLLLAAWGSAIGFTLPTIPPVARWLIRKLAPPGGADDKAVLRHGLTYGLSGKGWLAAVLTWTGFGTSVWLSAWAVGASDIHGWVHAPVWVLAAALPVVAGFLSLLPAGVLVREGLTLSLLAPLLGEANALATTLASRVIWVAAETLYCAMLSLVWRRQHGRHHDDPERPRPHGQ